jgi:DNA mismatch repair protein MutL
LGARICDPQRAGRAPRSERGGGFRGRACARPRPGGPGPGVRAQGAGPAGAEAARTRPDGDGAAPVAAGPDSCEPSRIGDGPGIPAETPRWRYLGLAHGHFALFESPSGLILLDRRSAHQRVWFERLCRQFRAGGVPVQRLLLPIPLELDPVAAALLLDHREFLRIHGFDLAEFGRNFFRIEALPAWLEPGDAAPFLRDLVAAFRAGRLPSGQLELAREELARLAVAKAIRLAPAAGETELRAVLAELFATEQPLASPSGRPTFIELNHGEIARRFLMA